MLKNNPLFLCTLILYRMNQLFYLSDFSFLVPTNQRQGKQSQPSHDEKWGKKAVHQNLKRWTSKCVSVLERCRSKKIIFLVKYQVNLTAAETLCPIPKRKMSTYWLFSWMGYLVEYLVKLNINWIFLIGFLTK